MSTHLKPPQKYPARSSQRLPPPSLFQGPSSCNASNVSLSSGLHLNPQQSSGSTQPWLPLNNGPPSPRRTPQEQGRDPMDCTDALWNQMQNILAEVELTATSGDQAFGSYSSKAAEDLRAKQLALAQSWARSGSEEVADNLSPASDPPAVETNEPNPHDFLDDKTEKDIIQARKRRKANDLYFERVNNDVLDVVTKLEDVAEAMRELASKSKEVWGESKEGSNGDS